jgi:signal transduction histidine kinase
LASLFVAVLAGFLLARPLSRPIELLKNAALDVATGALGKEVDTGAGGEIGELTAAFNHMSRSLRQNYESLEAQSQEIERFNLELQDRVEARTRELREAQGELVRSGQLAAVAEVGAGLAHELNNPLSGILGLAQVLRMKFADSPEAALLGQMESEANRCREVVDTMLKLSERTHGDPKKNMINVASLLSEVAKRSMVSFRQRGVALDVDETPSSLMVFAPREETVRILNQILQSMRAGLSSGASLKVVAEDEGDEIKIVLTPDRPVASGEARDDWMASGAALWVARQMLDQIEGRMSQPAQDALQWAIYLPKGVES